MKLGRNDLFGNPKRLTQPIFFIRHQGAELLSTKDEKMGVLAFFGYFKVILEVPSRPCPGFRILDRAKILSNCSYAIKTMLCLQNMRRRIRNGTIQPLTLAESLEHFCPKGDLISSRDRKMLE